MRISVIGCGRWGSFIAWYLNGIGKDVRLYGRENSEHIKVLMASNRNEYIEFPEGFKFTTNLEDTLKSDIIIISISSQNLRELMNTIKTYGLKNKIYVLCMKGIEIDTGLRLSQVVSEYIDIESKTALWIGPGHVQEFYRGVPNCMVIDSEDTEIKHKLVEEFSGNLIRFYYGNDFIGNEIGAATKNVIGIAAGILDGCNLSSLKGALMSRGTKEVSHLIKNMGGNPISAYGLCHLGDYEATIFSKHSNNRKFGEAFVKKEPFEKLAEGYHTVKAVIKLAKEYDTDMPISKAVYDILYNGLNPEDALEQIFLRSLKYEF